MESEGSLPQSKVPATRSYSEPARSSPYPHIPLPEEVNYVAQNVLCLFEAKHLGVKGTSGTFSQ